MVIKIFYITIAIFSVALCILMLQNPYEDIISKNGIKIANTIIEDVVDYEANSTNLARIYKAKIIKRYDDKDEFFDFQAEFFDDQNSTIKSKKVVRKDNKFEFLDDVRYQNLKNLKFSSKKVFYDIKDKNLTSPNEFSLTQNQNIITGKSLIYDTQNRQIFAKKVKIWYAGN